MVDYNPIPDQAPGLDAVKQWLAAARTAFPDLRGTVDDVVVENDRLAARVTWYGTHRCNEDPQGFSTRIQRNGSRHGD